VGRREAASTAGERFARDVERFIEEDVVDEFVTIARGSTDEELLAWLNSHVPAFMRLVPSRKRANFVLGIQEVIMAER